MRMSCATWCVSMRWRRWPTRTRFWFSMRPASLSRGKPRADRAYRGEHVDVATPITVEFVELKEGQKGSEPLWFSEAPDLARMEP